MNGPIEAALAVVAANPELADFVGPRDEALVAAAEAALGVSFPAPYRAFLLALGCGSFGGFEVYGVVSEPFDGPVPDAVWCTRSGGTFGPGVVVVGADGMGGDWVLDCTTGEVSLRYGAEAAEVVAEDFGTWLCGELDAEL